MIGLIRIITLVVLVNGLLSGCATITRGSTEAFQVKTDPSGAEVRLSSGETCTSPCTLEKKRKHNFTVFIEKSGYEKTNISVVSQVAGSGAAGMAGNVIFGGIIGAGVDAGTGATKELVPNPVEVSLNPIDPSDQSVSDSEDEEDEAEAYSQVSRTSMNAGGSPKQGTASGGELIAQLDKKVHQSIQGADYIWLDIEWQNSFKERQIVRAQGKIQIREIDSDREVAVPWEFEKSIPPSETVLAEEAGFEIKNTRPLKWLLRAKTEELEIEFLPTEVAFADGSVEQF